MGEGLAGSSEAVWAGVAAALADGIEAMGLGTDDGLADRILGYLRLLERWNRVYNLTAIAGPEDWVARHVLDCLAILPHLRGRSLLDVGTGAGLPGLLVAMARPDVNVVMLDRSRRKTCFVEQAAAGLGLDNARVEHCRVEAFVAPAGFDCIVSRALTHGEAFLRLTRHLAHERSRWLLMKGRRPDEELVGLTGQGWRPELRRLDVPGLPAERHLLIIDRDTGLGKVNG